MIRNVFRLLSAALAMDLLLATPGFADLFALINTTNEILRIDSASGAVTQTIPAPEFFPSTGGLNSGMAFDGRVLYVSRSVSFTDLLFMYDVVDSFWYPQPVFLPTMQNPAFPPQPVSGLGIMPDGFGGGNLFAVSANPAGDPPSYLYQLHTYGPWFDVVGPVADPIGLAPNLNANGADVDSATGEVWISAGELGVPSPNLRLLHIDLAGNVLATLSPDLGAPNLIRGLGFNNGSMFVAGRNPVAMANYVYEINRSTGEVIRSFTLPVASPVAALTGGAVFNPVPEPGSLVLVAIGCVLAQRRRPKRCPVLPPPARLDH
jgi:hypothetical protein